MKSHSSVSTTLREKCPDTEFFLVRIFLYSDWIRGFTQFEYRKVRTRKNSVFGHFSRSTRISICTVVAEILSWVPSKKHSIPLWVWLKLRDIYLSIWTRCICKCSCNQRNTSLKFCANNKWFTYSMVEWSFSATSFDLKPLSTSFALLFFFFFNNHSQRQEPNLPVFASSLMLTNYHVPTVILFLQSYKQSGNNLLLKSSFQPTEVTPCTISPSHCSFQYLLRLKRYDVFSWIIFTQVPKFSTTFSLLQR